MDKNFRMRLGIGFLLVALLGLGVMVRAGYIMLVPSKRLASAMERQFRQDAPVIARRGYILDRNREPIAVSMEVKSLYANPGKMDHKTQAAAQLAKILGLPMQQLRSKLKADKGFVWIKRQLTDKEEEALNELLEKHPALSLSLGLAKESKRFYPNQNLASQLLGFTGLDSNGLEGLELYYDKELAGGAVDKKASMDGKTLVLTIDKALQHTLEEELEAGAKMTGAKAATAILMDADNGDILAMGSYPSYNPNKLQPGNADARRNRPITDTYEPGSTMKAILVAGALEAKAITPKTKVFCEYGSMQIGKHKVNEAESHDKWGWLKIGEVLQHSSNIGATKIGFLFGPEAMYRWYKKMGLTQRTGVDLPGEVGGVLTDPKTWSKIAQSNLSFGQGVSVTPMQMIRAYAAFANGGKLVKPRLLKQLYSFEGEFLKELPAQEPVRVMEERVSREVTEMLEKVASSEGTAPKAAIPGFTVVGKTGTAQKAFQGHGYKSGKYMASFIGFVKDVSPRMVALVVVDEPRFPYFGGEAAAPVFRRIMTAALAREGIAPKENLGVPLQIGQAKAVEKRVPPSEKMESAVPVLTENADSYTMPNLVGVSAREVLDLFDKKDVQLRLHGGGLVVDQVPRAGAVLKRGDTVSIRLEHDAGTL